MTSILETIAAKKRLEVQTAKQQCSLSKLQAQSVMPTRDFVAALSEKKPAIIAEIKKASPSKGIIRESFDPEEIAQIYTKHGAACLSVLTDETFFQGHPTYIQQVKAQSPLPILRKDFIIDDYQIYESRALGSDCILLIVALLDDNQLLDFCQLAQALDLAVLVESHTQDELERALRLPTPLMGVNNRSLHHFSTSLSTSFELRKQIPADKMMISESGINTRHDIEELEAHDIHSFLVGESLMRHPNIGEKLDELLGRIV